MKHLYNLKSNASLLNRNPNLVSFDISQTQEKRSKDFDLLSALSMVESDTDVEPSDAIIEFLLNYSKSLNVQHLSNCKKVCVFNNN